MHRVIRDHLEEILRADESALAVDSGERNPAQTHLFECEECSVEIAAMREHARGLRQMRAEVEPRPGFYARVRERIEAQGATSIWNVFSDSPFGRRIAVASMTLALALGIYLVTSERMPEQASVNVPTVQFVADFAANEDQPGPALSPTALPDRDSVLVNLVTYREQ